MATVKHASRIREVSKNASRNSIVYTGSMEEMRQIQSSNGINSINAEIGRITSSRVYQEGGTIWCCELVAELSSDGTATTGPDTSYGKKSASLHGTMLSMPLETHPDYRANWNHFLAVAPGVTQAPSWWNSAEDTLLSEANAQKYCWCKDVSDAPETGGKRWRILKKPVMEGVETYDLSTYSCTVSARFGSFSAATNMVANVLNRIGIPGVTLGISGGDWKCDDATVAWHDKYWLATLTWTRSGDTRGWNKKLYKGV